MTSLPAPFATTYQMTVDEIIEHGRDYLANLHEAEKQCIQADNDIRKLLSFHTAQVDSILCAMWTSIMGESRASLVAIGGYGRGELFPRSDIDLIILIPESIDETLSQDIERFVQQSWSLGLDIAQSVATVDQSLADAHTDIDLLTSLLETRLVCGEPSFCEQIRRKIVHLITPLQFIKHKIDEQHFRDQKQEQMGRLEPNIKIAPGGLRDVHMIGWINTYVYHSHHYEHMIERGLLSKSEYDDLIESTEILWRIRFALHLYGHTKKDVLDFDRQKTLACLFGYLDNDSALALEQFMRLYYRHTMRIRRTNRLLVKLIEADITPNTIIKIIDEPFETRNNQLALRSDHSLAENPLLIWKLFKTLQKHPHIRGIHPTLARAIRSNRDAIFTPAFLNNPESYREFVDILNHPGEVFPQIRRMHRYGLLYLFIPAFWQTVGRMQYDLFHQYTVDQHTLRLINYIDQFKTPNADYPQAHDLLINLAQPALLYIAALFHDIGKGLGGDHSKLGAQIVAEFCQKASIFNEQEQTLLVFLVRHHLSLSITAQKKDLSDPEVIADFVQIFPNPEALDYLYLLTLADVSATNSTLWNSWRANLFHTLYQLSAKALASPMPSSEQLVEIAQQAATPLLAIDAQVLDALWTNLPDYFFLNESPAIIANKTYQLHQHQTHAVSLIQRHPTRLFISSTHAPDKLFAIITHFLEKRDLDIYEARLYTSEDNALTIQQFTLSDSQLVEDNLSDKLKKVIEQGELPKPLTTRMGHRSMKFFHPDTDVTYEQDPTFDRTIIHLICKDRHGLLSTISRVFLSLNIHLVHAKIATFGEKVEDTFYVTDADQRAITQPDILTTLKNTLIEVLKSED